MSSTYIIKRVSEDKKSVKNLKKSKRNVLLTSTNYVIKNHQNVDSNQTISIGLSGSSS